MPTNHTPGRSEPIASTVRALPSTPSLEYEHKQAKALLRRIRAGDSDALRRVQATHPAALRDRQPNELRLADVQHVIAREYGFTSWPRLVEYFEEMERHRHGLRYNSSDGSPDHFEDVARSMIRRHQRGDPILARELSHFVPRFYGRSTTEILATPITEYEARLVVAREKRRASWEELVERANASRAMQDRDVWEGAGAPIARARLAIRTYDVNALAAILDEHPELLTPSVIDREWRRTPASMAVSFECEARTAKARRVTDFLASRGVDIQRELNERLLGFPTDREQPERVRWYLDRGADPNWMPPNGIAVLEHALIMFMSAQCVDLIAQRVRPRRALWIAAGLGDVTGVRSFIAGKGTLTPEGRLNRPDPMAIGWFVGLPPNFEADDLEIIWEAFLIAGLNDRWAAMDVLLEAGLPVDHAPIGWPLLMWAVGTLQRIPLIDYLIKRGASLDREWPPHGSARALARQLFEGYPQSEAFRRMLEICDAGKPDEVLAQLDETRQSPPPLETRTLRAMQLAADDAARQGQSVVNTANMLIGLLRVQGGVFAEFLMATDTDMRRLREMIGPRLLPDNDPLAGQDLPADAGSEAALRVATAEADARRRESVSPLYLIKGILSQESEPGAMLLGAVGMNRALVVERLDPAL
jgi:hypothetical protein